MLVLTRKVGSSIIIDGRIKIQIVKIKGRQVRLSIEAPREVRVHREEVQRSLENTPLASQRLKPAEPLSL